MESELSVCKASGFQGLGANLAGLGEVPVSQVRREIMPGDGSERERKWTKKK